MAAFPPHIMAMARTPDKRDHRRPVAETPAAEIDAFLNQVRKAPPAPRDGANRGRLIFSLDATMSREPMWDRACQIQGEMFEATSLIGGLDVQLVFYRGYGECKAGKWQPDAKGLARMMSAVRCMGGRTQIGKILTHGEKEAAQSAKLGRRVGALVFVGDAFEEDIDAVCQKAGALGLHGVPVFMFQEGRDPIAEKAFREIARLTGGAWCPFDLASPDQLKRLLSAVAVYAAGGIPALEDYSKAGGGGEARQIADRLSGRR